MASEGLKSASSKHLKYGGNATIFVLLLFGILVLFNFLSTRRFIRADLTEDKRYTISDATKNVLSSLDDIVTITAYFSTEPAEVAQIRRSVRDVLDEYQAFSQKLQIDFVNPVDFDAGKKQELRFKGIPEVQMNVIREDKAEIANVYLGIGIGYSGKEEVLAVVQSTANLEYELTSTILKVTTKEAKTVGFLKGHNEFDIYAQTSQRLLERLDKNAKGQYNLTTVELQGGESVPNTVSTLIIAGPKQVVEAREKYEIDQFIMRGGKAIFLIDSMQLQPGSLQGTPLSTGLNELLEHYGVKLGNNVLIDRRFHDSARFQRGFMTVIQPYPYFVKIIKDNFSQESTVTNQLEGLTLPWTSSLEVATPEGVTGTVLAKTSEFSQSIQGFYNLEPNLTIPEGELQAYPVAVALEGKFGSFYADKEIPPVKTGTDDTDKAPGEKTALSEDAAASTPLTESQPTQIVVLGTAKSLTQMRPDGIDFFLNTVDWMTLGDALIGIRSQTITERPLREISEIEKNFIKYLCIAGVPLLVVIFGLLRYLLKRRAKRLVETYGSL